MSTGTSSSTYEREQVRARQVGARAGTSASRYEAGSRYEHEFVRARAGSKRGPVRARAGMCTGRQVGTRACTSTSEVRNGQVQEHTFVKCPHACLIINLASRNARRTSIDVPAAGVRVT